MQKFVILAHAAGIWLAFWAHIGHQGRSFRFGTRGGHGVGGHVVNTPLAPSASRTMSWDGGVAVGPYGTPPPKLLLQCCVSWAVWNENPPARGNQTPKDQPRQSTNAIPSIKLLPTVLREGGINQPKNFVVMISGDFVFVMATLSL